MPALVKREICSVVPSGMVIMVWGCFLAVNRCAADKPGDEGWISESPPLCLIHVA